MTTEEKQRALKKIFWDYDFSEQELQDLLGGKILRAGHLDKVGLYSRLLASLNWYAILDLVELIIWMICSPMCNRRNSFERSERKICRRKKSIIPINFILCKMRC